MTGDGATGRPVDTRPGAQPGRLRGRRSLYYELSRRMGWGLADQGVSSITNFAASIYIARSLGAVRYGAFSLAYLTYSFVLNASRGLATDPLLVRFSGAEPAAWRRATASCAGTALAVGLAGAVFTAGAALVIRGPTRAALLALALSFPGLLLQDSWRFSFFAMGRGAQALLNDSIWAAGLVPLVALLKSTGHIGVFGLVLAWGGAANIAAGVGVFQTGTTPSLRQARRWVSTHRDLGPRYLAEGTANSAATQLRTYGIGALLGLAAVGYVQAATTLMGPFMVAFFGMGLVALPEAVRLVRISAGSLNRFCLTISAGLAVGALAWGLLLWYTLPRGLGQFLLPSLWRPTYPLVLPLTISIIGGCMSAGAGIGLHALGAARRSLRAVTVGAAAFIACSLIGAGVGGALGAVQGTAVATAAAAVLYWWELRVALREHPRPETGAAPTSLPETVQP